MRADSMTATAREAAFVSSLDERARDIVERCSRCGRCVEVCPTGGPAGVDRTDPTAVVTQVLGLLRGEEDAATAGARWAQTCTGSGACLTACDDGVNPRLMLALTRVRLAQRQAADDRRERGQKAFQTMSQGVKVLSRLQLPAPVVGAVTRAARAETGPPRRRHVPGCNVLRRASGICLDVLDRIGTRYAVFGGPANAAGCSSSRAGDTATRDRSAGTVAGFAATGAPQVLTWCPDLQHPARDRDAAVDPASL
jgi:Fe-S oxidoreductase